MAFGYYKSLTLDATQAGSSDSTDWPLAICLDGNVQAADADLRTVGNGGYVESANGYDIRPYADAALTTPLDFELVVYDGTTGVLEMHVRIPTLSHTTNTVIYLAFGDAGISTDGSSSATWNGAFTKVCHLKDGTTLSGHDSTSNADDLTLGTNATAAAGEIDGGMNTNNPGTATSGTLPVANLLLPITVSGWINLVQNGSNDFLGTGSNLVYRLRQGGSPRLTFSGVADYDFTTITTPTSGWFYLAFSVGNSTTSATVYLGSGGSVASETLSIGTPGGSDLSLGFALSFNDLLDELRISSVARSSSWATADYHSQQASSTFITWGALTPVTPPGGFVPRLPLLGAG